MVHFSIMKGEGILEISLEKCNLIQRQAVFFFPVFTCGFLTVVIELKIPKIVQGPLGLAVLFLAKILCKNAGNDLTVRFTPRIIS